MCLTDMKRKNTKNQKKPLNNGITSHYQHARYKRENFINKYIHDDGHIIDGFIVDKGHKNGAEVHSITDNGIIIIHNLTSGALVTKLIAREWQLRRYYEGTNRVPPKELENALYLARWHESLGYNQV